MAEARWNGQGGRDRVERSRKVARKRIEKGDKRRSNEGRGEGSLVGVQAVSREQVLYGERFREESVIDVMEEYLKGPV